jgi:hypothetical protein
MEAALVIPQNLSGKILKVVTRDFESGPSGPYKPLRGKKYDDNTPILTPLKDIVEALGGTYTELDIDNIELGR